MKSGLSASLFVAACFWSVAAFAEPQLNPGFEGAGTDAERALDGALKKAEKGQDYSSSLTPAFTAAMAREHVDILCGQGGFSENSYKAQSTSSRDDGYQQIIAVIHTKRPTTDIVRYKVITAKGGLKIDGIACAGKEVNFKPDDHII